MATLQHTAHLDRSAISGRQRQHNPINSACLVELSTAIFQMVVGGIIAGLLLLVSSSSSTQVLGATSLAITALYFANLSESQNVKDFLSMVIPAIAIISLLLWNVSDALLIGLSLIIHLTVSFYNALSNGNGAVSELNLWPGLLGFQSVLVAFWGFTF